MFKTQESQESFDAVDAIAKLLRNARCISVLTGAGVSKESGIPTFRDAQTGLWAKYNPAELASPEGFERDPSLVWQWYDARRRKLKEVSPNPGHFAIAELELLARCVGSEKVFEEFTVITQNVDGLHQQAGSRNVVELHGNITTFHCFDGLHPAHDVPEGLTEPPRCHCGSPVRPSVVWFGEALPPGCFDRAADAARKSDLMFVIGTSGLVHPAASLPSIALKAGAKIVEINRETTPITDMADVFLEQESGKAMPAIVARYKEL